MPLTACCSCGGSLTEVLDLGPMHLADFIDPGAPPGEPWPLTLMLCGSCSLLQLREPTPRKLLLHERYGFRSGVNEANRQDLADIAAYALSVIPEPKRWLDIGSNDGTLLSFAPFSAWRAGIDPLDQFVPDCSRYANRVVADYFSPDLFAPGEFDVITAGAMFYELEDPGQFVTGVRDVLATRGAWIIQQNYALDMLRNNVADNIIHEHVTYFSVRSLRHLLERHGLEINDVTYSYVKGGCIRTLVSHKGARPVSASVADALEAERHAGLDRPATWERWGETVRAELARTRDVAEQAKALGKRTWVYGASTRGGTLLQVIGGGPDLFPYAVERDPHKFGKIWASTGIPIISEEEMRADPPDYLLVSPWFFGSHFARREAGYLAGGGRLILPLPRFEVIEA